MLTFCYKLSDCKAWCKAKDAQRTFSVQELELKPSLSAKSGPYTPWKWQIDGALSEAAQTLTKNRSLQMETERQRLWQAAGADPESIKQYGLYYNYSTCI